MTSTAEILPPAEIVDSFYPDGLAGAWLLAGGMINATYLTMDPAGNKAITQRLHDIFDPVIMQDLAVVSEHLRQDGLEAASIIPTKAGELYATDDTGKVWRSFTYIEHDPPPVSYDNETLVVMGGLLARLHKSLKNLDYIPRFGIPQFHDTGYYAAQLEGRIDQMPDVATDRLGQNILAAYQGMPELPDLGTQLIHADPRTQNMLFRNGKPFTFVDLDTIMTGSPWIDVGDFLRALTHDAIAVGMQEPAKGLPYATDGYLAVVDTGMDRVDFRLAALAAARLITLELGMRFMADIVDDNYFEWDQERFPNRQANHMSQVGLQLRVHESLLTAEQGCK